jgi:hypothetical protein
VSSQEGADDGGPEIRVLAEFDLGEPNPEDPTDDFCNAEVK